jgi:cytochrome c-type biogenesis protein CcmF
VVAAIIRNAHVSARARPQGYLRSLGGLFRADPGFWGGMIAHTGVALVAVAISFSSSFDTRTEITLSAGESAAFDGYTLTYVAPFAREESNRVVIGAEFELYRGTRHLATLHPRLNQYDNQVQAIPTPAVHTGLREDVYLSLVRIEQGTSAVTIDAMRFPLMWMLWLGGLVVVAGGAWSFTAKRRTRDLRPAEVSGV